MANLYFDETLETVATGEVLTVVGEEARHAVRVSRLRVGEETLVGNGRGLVARGTVTDVDRDRFSMLVATVDEHPAHDPENSGECSRIILVQALAKGDRDERAVELATEFGVDAVQPWQAERSVSRWDGLEGEKTAKGRAKWSRIAREASKQSMRAWIPEVLPLTSIAELCGLAASSNVIVLHPRSGVALSAWAADAVAAHQLRQRDTYLVVGPEGGLSDNELDALENAGASIRVLGKTVLRTSSAGPAAIALLNTSMGRW